MKDTSGSVEAFCEPLIRKRSVQIKIKILASKDFRIISLFFRDRPVRRVAPADFSAGALARSVLGRFDHTAPPLIRLMEVPRCLHTPLAWETGNPCTDQGTVSSSALIVGFGG